MTWNSNSLCNVWTPYWQRGFYDFTANLTSDFDEARPKNHHCQRFHRKVILQKIKDTSQEMDFKLLPSVLLSFEKKSGNVITSKEIEFWSLLFIGEYSILWSICLCTSNSSFYKLYLHWNILFIFFIFALFKLFRDRKFSIKETR